MDSCLISAKGCRKGYALLLVLLAIAIIAILTMVDIKAIFGWDTPGNPEDCPWLEETRLITDGSEILLPESPKPTLDKFGDFSMTVTDERNEQRGSVELVFTADGILLGGWSQEFTVGDVECTYSTSFEGNIDITKTYEDENGNVEPSWLFFIGKGRFSKMGYHVKASRGAVGGGTAWISGWLKPDGTAEGKMVLAFDKKNTEIYTLNR